MYILYKKINFILSHLKKYKKNQLRGITKSLRLSIRIWSKFQKHHKNHFVYLIFVIYILLFFGL
jgi:hypothetical protein